MPRAKAILQSEFPYFVTARCINREWFRLDMQDVWKIFCAELFQIINDKKVVVHSFVLMTNHFHLIISTPEANISQAMHQFMHRSSRKLTQAGNRINESFAGRHYKTILQHPNYYLNAYKYLYRNPVRADICDSVEKYPFSTLRWVLGWEKPLFALAPDFTYENDRERTLQWLNTESSEEKVEAVRYALKRQRFSPKRDRRTNKPLISESEII